MERNELRIILAAERERTLTAAIITMGGQLAAMPNLTPRAAEEISKKLEEASNNNSWESNLKNIDKLIALAEK